jgi:dienelactone hydrolase
MADIEPPKPEPAAYDTFIRAEAARLRADDQPPTSRKDWEVRRSTLRERMTAALGALPDQPCPLEAEIVGSIKRPGYRIEKVIFQSRPDVWVTANAYVSEPDPEKRPAVLVVHGHWPWARRDPVVQARCLGLVKLGFFVLAVDAFGAGERFPEPARGTYHGALFGSALWPAGLTLLGQQVYDNRRAIDYLQSRPEVDGNRIGITGASGGGNQSMYAGALDDRLKVVVPVCSVGTYQAYLQAACCVCEVLPGALRFTEEGDVLGLVAPRALLVISANQDAFQFSVGEAKKSLARAQAIFQLHDAAEKVEHAVFESKHDYNQPMRERMYGWMSRWLKDEGDGKPIPEAAHEVENPEDLSCFADKPRPKGFLFPATLAAGQARGLLARFSERPPDHADDWESTAVSMRAQLRKLVFGDFPKTPRPAGELGKAEIKEGVRTTPLRLQTEDNLPLQVLLLSKSAPPGLQRVCVLLHLDGKAEAVKYSLAAALQDKGWLVVAPDLRATGESRPAGDLIHDAADHNSAEHALWIGRPLLGQWVFDIQCLLDWLAIQPGLDRRFALAGIGPTGVVALCASGLMDDQVTSTVLINAPISLITEQAYRAGMRMGLLAPGLLGVGDLPHLAGLTAPRRLVIAAGVTPQGTPVEEQALIEGHAFTRMIYRLYKAEEMLTVTADVEVAKVVEQIERERNDR